MLTKVEARLHMSARSITMVSVAMTNLLLHKYGSYRIVKNRM